MQTLQQQPNSLDQQGQLNGPVQVPRQYLPIYYGGLEPIQESEISSQDNTRAFSDRKPEFQFQAPSYQTSQRDRSESERSAGAYEALMGKISFLESELVKERASTNVLRKEKSSKRQETEEKKMLQEDLSVVSARIEELEDKLTNISTENQRLQSLISNQKSTINDLQGKNKLLSSTQVGAATRSSTTQIVAEDNSRTREQISEQMRTFWKEHFERVQAVMIERYEAEKRSLMQELDLKQQLNKKLQASFNMERQTSVECQEELKRREVEVTQVQICLNELEMKLMDLKNINEQQSEQLSRMNEIESEAEKVLQENTRLQNELQETMDEKQSAEKEANKQKEGLKFEQITQNKQWQDRLNLEQEQLARSREQWEFQEAELTKELDDLKVQEKELKELNSSLEQQVIILEDDKEKLLVILTGKTDLENELNVTNEKNAKLEVQVTQLLQSNSVLNSSLNSRLKEIGMWKDRHAKSVDECRRVSSEYQEQISRLIEEQGKELQEEKTKNAKTIEQMKEQLFYVQDKLEQYQMNTSQQHLVELEQQKRKVQQLNDKLSNSQEEVTCLQQCLIELEQLHQKKINEQNDEWEKQLQNLLNQKDSKISKLSRDREEIKMLLQQTEVLNDELKETLIEQQKAHQQAITRIFGERNEFNSRILEGTGQPCNFQVENRIYDNYPSEQDSKQRQMFEVSQRQQEYPGNRVQDRGFEEMKGLDDGKENNNYRDYELFGGKQKDKRKLFEEKVNKPNKRDNKTRGEIDTGSQYQPLFQHTQTALEQQQQQSRSSGPLFPVFNPLGNYRSSLNRNIEDPRDPKDKISNQDNDMSLQEKQLKREVEYLQHRDQSQKEIIESLSGENKQLQTAYRDLERKFYTKNDGLYEKQGNQEDDIDQEQNLKEKEMKFSDRAQVRANNDKKEREEDFKKNNKQNQEMQEEEDIDWQDNTDKENKNENQDINMDRDDQEHGSYHAVSQEDKEDYQEADEGEGEEQDNQNDQEQSEEKERENGKYNEYGYEEELQDEDYDPLNNQEDGEEQQQFDEDNLEDFADF